jgi:hypothetical protein
LIENKKDSPCLIQQELSGISKIGDFFYSVISSSLIDTTSRSKIRSFPAKG